MDSVRKKIINSDGVEDLDYYKHDGNERVKRCEREKVIE